MNTVNTIEKGISKIASLLNEVAAATEILDTDYINELEPQVMDIAMLYPGHEDVITMESWIEEARQKIGRLTKYDGLMRLFTSEQLICFGTDEIEAEHRAEDAAFRGCVT